MYIAAYSFELLVHKPSNKRAGRNAAEIIIMQDLWFFPKRTKEHRTTEEEVEGLAPL